MHWGELLVRTKDRIIELDAEIGSLETRHRTAVYNIKREYLIKLMHTTLDINRILLEVVRRESRNGRV